jgi:hypothetical protein
MVLMGGNIMSNDIRVLARSLTRQLHSLGHNAFCAENWSPEILIWPDHVTAYFSTPIADSRMICNLYDSHLYCGPTKAGASRRFEYCNPEFPDNMYEYVNQFMGEQNGD